ncbi:MAG: YqeG family HAD IIIA-type phosphatase [Candidatus Woesearchaeota archaeon]
MSISLKDVRQELTPANALSLSRPFIAAYGLHNFADDPTKLALTFGAAFLTDTLDGVVARMTHSQSKLGGYMDLIGDRGLEMVSLWGMASHGMISYIFPVLYTAKGAVVDTLRVVRDAKRGSFRNPTQYGGNDSKAQRFTYSVSKISFVVGAPVFPNLVTDVLGTVATAYGLFRATNAVVNVNPADVKPDLRVQSINDLSTAYLHELGVKGIVFDVDNTLCAHGETTVDEHIRGRLTELTSAFPSCILTNADSERKGALEGMLGIPVIRSQKRKPAREPYHLALDYLGTKPNETAMVGDRVLTDVLGAKRAGMVAIKVDPIDKYSEPLNVRLARMYERIKYGNT